MNSAWYEEWFNKDYLSLYAHRNQSEADRQVEFLFSQDLLQPDDVVLDSACGAGRHLHALSGKVGSAFGIDLSPDLLHEAQTRLENSSDTIQLLRGDMRSVPLASNSVDVVLSMFTSFGYFESDAEHLRLLKEWHRLLRPGGRLVIDYLNRPQILEGMQNNSTDTINGNIVAQKRSLSADQLRIEKRIEIQDQNSGESHVFLESVRMYDLEDLRELLTAAGFLITNIFGDFNGSTYSASSDRLIVAALAPRN